MSNLQRPSASHSTGPAAVGRRAAPGKRSVWLGEPRLAIRIEVEALHLLETERTGADAAEDSHLMAGLIDTAVAVEALGQSQRGFVRAEARNQLGFGLRAEAIEFRLQGRGSQLQHF